MSANNEQYIYDVLYGASIYTFTHIIYTRVIYTIDTLTLDLTLILKNGWGWSNYDSQHLTKLNKTYWHILQWTIVKEHVDCCGKMSALVHCYVINLYTTLEQVFDNIIIVIL